MNAKDFPRKYIMYLFNAQTCGIVIQKGANYLTRQPHWHYGDLDYLIRDCSLEKKENSEFYYIKKGNCKHSYSLEFVRTCYFKAKGRGCSDVTFYYPKKIYPLLVHGSNESTGTGLYFIVAPKIEPKKSNKGAAE